MDGHCSCSIFGIPINPYYSESQYTDLESELECFKILPTHCKYALTYQIKSKINPQMQTEFKDLGILGVTLCKSNNPLFFVVVVYKLILLR